MWLCECILLNNWWRTSSFNIQSPTIWHIWNMFRVYYSAAHPHQCDNHIILYNVNLQEQQNINHETFSRVILIHIWIIYLTSWISKPMKTWRIHFTKQMLSVFKVHVSSQYMKVEVGQRGPFFSRLVCACKKRLVPRPMILRPLQGTLLAAHIKCKCLSLLRVKICFIRLCFDWMGHLHDPNYQFCS